MFYAAHNTYGADGFLNTWEISRFKSKADRDAFVDMYAHKAAKAVTRRKAAEIYTATYTCVGKDAPAGGLFGRDRYGLSRFWNENLWTGVR